MKIVRNVLSPLATIEGPSVYVLAVLDEYTKHLNCKYNDSIGK